MREGTHGMAQVDYEQRMDMDRMREYRVSRIKKYMDEFDVECLLCLLYTSDAADE